MAGASVASPLALALSGMASDPEGRIRLADIPAAARDMFARFDADSSGGLSRLEHSRWAEAILGDPYGRPSHLVLDRDNSSAVSRDELVRFFETAAARMDANGDGLLERFELLREVPQSRGGRQGRQGGGRPGRG